MTIVGVERRAKARPREAEVEQIKRLIEIQSQIVELAKQNELTEQQCEMLRHDLARGTRRPSVRQRLSMFLRGLFRRAPAKRSQSRDGDSELN
jgi:hypothetical protein